MGAATEIDCSDNAEHGLRTPAIWHLTTVWPRVRPATSIGRESEAGMRSVRVKMIVEIALSVALAAVLGLWKITLPWNFAGGSVSLTMLPVLIVAVRRGLWAGVTAGAIFGGIDYLMEPFFVHPLQVVLDYPLAFGACGLAGLGAGLVASALRKGPNLTGGLAAAPWMLLGGAGRFACSFASGMVFFGANAPDGQPVWLYSLVYNASYLAPSVIACTLLGIVLVPALERAVPASYA